MGDEAKDKMGDMPDMDAPLLKSFSKQASRSHTFGRSATRLARLNSSARAASSLRNSIPRDSQFDSQVWLLLLQRVRWSALSNLRKVHDDRTDSPTACLPCKCLVQRICKSCKCFATHAAVRTLANTRKPRLHSLSCQISFQVQVQLQALWGGGAQRLRLNPSLLSMHALPMRGFRCSGMLSLTTHLHVF